MRDYHKLEGYTMFKDGYVIDLTSADFDTSDYVALKVKVKTRTKDKDPLTNRKYYQCWLILTSAGCIHSAYFTCKGGIDGFCRHVVATLFEVNDFLNDEDKTTCTSKPCTWKRRACDKLSQPIPAKDLDTSVLSLSSCQSPRPNYYPLAEDVPKPDKNELLNKLQTLCPNACLLKSVTETAVDVNTQPPLTVTTPMQKLTSFVSSHKCIINTCSCATIFMYYHLPYTPEQCTEIEKMTRGQCKNKNWHDIRKGILTSSTFHQICCSTDITNTAQSLIKPGLDESSLPLAISFGRMYESKARNIFIKGHRFRHRKCNVEVPGLIFIRIVHTLALPVHLMAL